MTVSISNRSLQDGFRSRDSMIEEDLNIKLMKIQQIKDYHKRHSLSKIERHEVRNVENKRRVDILMSKDDMRAQANLSQMRKLEKKTSKCWWIDWKKLFQLIREQCKILKTWFQQILRQIGQLLTLKPQYFIILMFWIWAFHKYSSIGRKLL